MFIDKDSTSTAFLAVYGALLASITFGWTLYRDLRDRAKVKLSARVRRIGVRPDGLAIAIEPSQKIGGVSNQLFVVVSVVNVGRRPVRWSGLGGYYKNPVDGKDGFIVNTRFLPKMLEEQEALDEHFELDTQFIDDNIKRFYIWDATGKHWNVSRSDMQKLFVDARKYTKQDSRA